MQRTPRSASSGDGAPSWHARSSASSCAIRAACATLTRRSSAHCPHGRAVHVSECRSVALSAAQRRDVHGGVAAAPRHAAS
jgi:hypothetical protein